MKKLPFLLIVLIVCSCLSIHAQVINSIGFRGGISSTFPNLEELQNGQPANDYILNRNWLYPELQFELFPRSHFSLLTNYIYISKGFEYWDCGVGGWFGSSRCGRIAAKINYSTISATPKFSWQINNIAIYGFAGPYFGIRHGYDEHYRKALFFMPDNQDVKFLNPTVWGGTIGTGIKFKGKNKKYYHSAQAQFMYDFTLAGNHTQNSIDRYGNYYDYKFKAKFQSLLLSYGLHYDLTKKE